MRFLTRMTWSNKVFQITNLFSIGTGVFLVVIVATISVAVISRYIFGHAILGVNEFVQLSAVALVMMAAPYFTANEGHVRVYIFDEVLGQKGRLLGDVLSKSLCILTLFFLARKSRKKMLDALEYGEALSTGSIAAGVTPFLMAMIVCLILIIIFPQIALIILNSMFD